MELSRFKYSHQLATPPLHCPLYNFQFLGNVKIQVFNLMPVCYSPHTPPRVNQEIPFRMIAFPQISFCELWRNKKRQRNCLGLFSLRPQSECLELIQLKATGAVDSFIYLRICCFSSLSRWQLFSLRSASFFSSIPLFSCHCYCWHADVDPPNIWRKKNKRKTWYKFLRSAPVPQLSKLLRHFRHKIFFSHVKLPICYTQTHPHPPAPRQMCPCQ